MLVVVVSVLSALAVLAASCSSDSTPDTDTTETSATIDGLEPEPELPTAEPAPTVAGNAVDVEVPEEAIASDVVIFGLDQTQRVQLRALPGADQPVVVELAPSDQIQSLEQLFETEDGAQWIQVQALGQQGWIAEEVAYRGPTQDVTEQSIASLDATTFASAEEAATAIGLVVAAQDGSAEVIVVGTTDVAGADSTTVIADVVNNDVGNEGGDGVALGRRLTIALDPAREWSPVSVFQSVLCTRGVTAQGECV